MKKLILLLLMLPNLASAQKTSLTDSLKAAVKIDSLKLSALYTEARKYGLAVDKRLVGAMQQVIKNTEGKAGSYAYRFKGEAYGALGAYYNNIGKYDEAAEAYTKEAEIGQQHKLGLIVAKANLGLGITADHLSEYEKSIEKNLLALKYFETVRDTIGIAAANGNIGNSYIRLDQHYKAIPLLAKAVDMYTRKGLTASAANNIANLARAYKGTGNRPKELELKLKSFAMFTAENYKKGIATVAATLGAFYEGDNNAAEAQKYYSLALKNSWAIGDIGNIALIYSNLANLHIKTNEPEKAMVCADSAAWYSRKSGDRLAQADAALVKGILLHIKRDHLKATSFVDRYISLRDSIYNGKMQRQVADMEVKYETTKKENEIALLNVANNNKALQLQNSALQLNKSKLLITEQHQSLVINQLRIKNQNQKLINQQLDADKRNENIKSLQKLSRIQTLEILNRGLAIKQKNYAITGILVLILAASVLVFSFYNRYRAKQTALMQQQRIKQQEQLTQAIIAAEEKERSRIASDLHDGVGQLFSAVKMNLSGLMERVSIARVEDRFLAEKTLALVEESCKEVRVISHQMMPNMLLRSGLASDVKSFIEKIDPERLKINVEATGFKNKLESNVEIVLYRVIQEAVNNVIKHAKASKLDIKLSRLGNGISAQISDDGVGFNTSEKNQLEGIGLTNIATRIAYLKGTVNYDSAPGKGTRVNVWVPVA